MSIKFTDLPLSENLQNNDIIPIVRDNVNYIVNGRSLYNSLTGNFYSSLYSSLTGKLVPNTAINSVSGNWNTAYQTVSAGIFTDRLTTNNNVQLVLNKNTQLLEFKNSNGSISYINMNGGGFALAGNIDTSTGGTPNNGGSITTNGNDGGAGGYINTSAGSCETDSAGAGVGGYINTSGGNSTNECGGGYNGGYIDTSNGGGYINTRGCYTASGGYIDTSAGSCLNGYNTHAGNGGCFIAKGGNAGELVNGSDAGSINTSNGGGSINTTGSGYIQFGYNTRRTTLSGSATTNRTILLPNKDGTLTLSSEVNTVSSQLVTTINTVSSQLVTTINTVSSRLTAYQSISSNFAVTAPTSVIATFQNSNETLRLFTTEDYGATLTEIGEYTNLVGGTFVRDPSITYYQDGNYYIAYTNNWRQDKSLASGNPPTFSILKSSDLANWTLHTTVSAPANSLAVWSPCFFTDTDGSLHTLFSASSSLDGDGYANKNQFYYTRPQTVSGNLSAWTSPVPVTLTGSSYVYDMFGAATIKVGSTYNLFFISGPGAVLYRATASSISGPYTVDPYYPNTCGVPTLDGIVNVNKLPNGVYRMIITTQNPYAAKIYDSTDLLRWTDKGWMGGDLNQNLYNANNTSGLNNSSMLILPSAAKISLATKGIPVVYTPSAGIEGVTNINKNQGSTSTSGTILPSTLPTLTVTLSGTVGTTSVSGTVVSSTGSYSLSSGMTLWFDGSDINYDGNPSPYQGEFQITKTGSSKFTFNTNRPVKTTNPTGTITAKNYWVTLFEGYSSASIAGLLTISTNAEGSRHRCVLAISTGCNSSDQPDIRVLTSSGYSFLSHVRISTLGDISGWVKIEARPAGSAGSNTTISATYQSLMGSCIPAVKPLKWGSNGPLAYSTRKYVGIGASNPRIINNWKMDLPAVDSGSYSYIYPDLQNNGTPDGPLSVSYGVYYQLDNMPSYTFTAHYPGLPERLILTNLGQGTGAAHWLTAQLYNPSGAATTATTVYGTLMINYGA